MTIRSSIVALAAVLSMVLFFAPSAHAQEKTDKKQTDEKPVMVQIQAGDTLTSIADTHKTTYVRIFNANDFIVNPDVINVGDKVRIPNADEELPDRYATLSAQQYAAPAPTSSAPAAPQQSAQPASGVSYGAKSSAGNTYYQGYCTWYAKERRPDLPNMLGNGGQWVANAAARGLATGSAPRAGAIAEIPGHVAYVESVNGNGTITISEMNGPAGFGVVGTRTVPASQYRYIY